MRSRALFYTTPQAVQRPLFGGGEMVVLDVGPEDVPKAFGILGDSGVDPPAGGV
jgi:hypothetical protein